MPTEKEVRRHRRWYTFLRRLCPILLRKYSYKTEVMEKPDEPSVILSNHLTEADLFMLASAFPDPVYYVGGEHLSRGILGALIKYIADPIFAPRGTVMLSTVLEILKRLKKGHNVAMFPEGCRSFNGETAPVTAATAKLVKKSGCGLVTYRIHGGYFIAPRWAYHFRRGHAEGEIVRVYSSRELREMSVDQLTEAINRDLHENAYEYQNAKRYKYKGKRLAEGLENYLVLCPSCGGYDTLTTHKNEFRCRCCGMSGSYDPYGYLQGEGLPYHTVYDWSKWMEERFDADMAACDKDVLFEEQNVRLYEVLPGHNTKDIATGSLSIGRDRIVFSADGLRREFAFDDMREKSLLYYGKTFLFTCQSGYYGLTGDRFHAWKLDRIFDTYKPERE